LGTAALLSSAPEALPDDGPDTHRSSPLPLQFDFGPGRVTGGHHKVTATSAYSRKRGFGFASTDGHTETDRGGQDTVRADFVTAAEDRKSTRLNSSHVSKSYAVFCLKKKKK